MAISASLAAPAKWKPVSGGMTDTSAAFDVVAGDLLVMWGVEGEASLPVTLTPSDNVGLTWLYKIDFFNGSNSPIWVWTALVPTDATGVVVTVTASYTSNWRWGVVKVKGASGVMLDAWVPYGLTTPPYTANAILSQQDGALVVWGDYNHVNASARTLYPDRDHGNVELDYYRNSSYLTSGCMFWRATTDGITPVGVGNFSGAKVSMAVIRFEPSGLKIPNGDFEAGIGSWYDAGPYFGFPPATLSIDSTNPHTGIYALNVLYPDSASGAPLVGEWVADGMTVGRRYTLSGWVLVPSGSPPVRIEGLFVGGTSTPLSSVHDTWEFLTKSFTYSGGPTLFVSCDCYYGGGYPVTAGQGFLVDGIRLIEEQRITVNQVVETDLAQVVDPGITIRRVTETDTALAITPIHTKLVVIGQPFEMSQAQQVTIAKNVLPGMTTETELAQPVVALTIGTTTVMTVAQATETDTAIAVAPALNPLIGNVRLVRTEGIDDHPRPRTGLWRRVAFPRTLPMLLLYRDGTVRELTSEGTQYDLVGVDYVIQGAWHGTMDDWQAGVLIGAGYTLRSEDR
jgi:hypothetical protein